MSDPTNEIRNIWAVGKNYADHAKELGDSPGTAKDEPMIFLKAGSGTVKDQGTFRLPPFSQDVHHEVELALRFNSKGEFTHLSVAIDLTARDLQSQLKSKGHPWTLAKSFRDACLMGPSYAISPDQELGNLQFDLKVNGAVRQNGRAADMIHSIESLRRYVFERFPVAEGDWLLTGTPVGVAALKPGDRLEAEIKGLLKASWQAAHA